jgi:hypothetical protein
MQVGAARQNGLFVFSSAGTTCLVLVDAAAAAALDDLLNQKRSKYICVCVCFVGWFMVGVVIVVVDVVQQTLIASASPPCMYVCMHCTLDPIGYCPNECQAVSLGPAGDEEEPPSERRCIY